MLKKIIFFNKEIAFKYMASSSTMSETLHFNFRDIAPLLGISPFTSGRTAILNSWKRSWPQTFKTLARNYSTSGHSSFNEADDWESFAKTHLNYLIIKAILSPTIYEYHDSITTILKYCNEHNTSNIEIGTILNDIESFRGIIVSNNTPSQSSRLIDRIDTNIDTSTGLIQNRHKNCNLKKYVVGSLCIIVVSIGLFLFGFSFMPYFFFVILFRYLVTAHPSDQQNLTKRDGIPLDADPRCRTSSSRKKGFQNSFEDNDSVIDIQNTTNQSISFRQEINFHKELDQASSSSTFRKDGRHHRHRTAPSRELQIKIHGQPETIIQHHYSSTREHGLMLRHHQKRPTNSEYKEIVVIRIRQNRLHQKVFACEIVELNVLMAISGAVKARFVEVLPSKDHLDATRCTHIVTFSSVLFYNLIYPKILFIGKKMAIANERLVQKN